MRFLAFSLAIAIAICTGISAPAFAQTASSAIPTCASGDPVVWVNTNTKKYHMQGDSYYGKTKQGKYLCKSAADAAGDKAAKMSSFKSSGATTGTNMNTGTMRAPMSGASPGTNMNTQSAPSSGAAPGTNMNPESAPSPVPSGKMRHKHHHTSSGATEGTNMNTDDSSPSPLPSGTTGHKRHHRHSASPSPDMAPSPAAT